MERFHFVAFGVLLNRLSTELRLGFSAAIGEGLVIVKAGAGAKAGAFLEAMSAIVVTT